jgi:two-component system, response regulator PdtaR
MSESDPIDVLIVEDDPLINASTANQLRRLGYAIAGQAYDAPEAIESVRRSAPAVVLMDLQLIDPETGREDAQAGLRAARTLRDSQPVAVVLLTAFESPELLQQASEAGVGAYLVKPARDSELDRAIAIARARFDDLVELRRLGAELRRQNTELQAALERIKTLSGLLPICAGCKRIRDDRGYWQQVECYIQDHSEARFSHGLCPECAVRLYPEVFRRDDNPAGDPSGQGRGSVSGSSPQEASRDLSKPRAAGSRPALPPRPPG